MAALIDYLLYFRGINVWDKLVVIGTDSQTLKLKTKTVKLSEGNLLMKSEIFIEWQHVSCHNW